MNPEIGNFDLKPHFRAWDREYESLVWGGPRSIKAIREHLPEGSRVLDAGCGNGRYLLPLSRNYRVIGIDVSLNGIRAARSYLDKYGCSAEYMVSDLTRLPLCDNSVDGIVCYGVLHHLFEEEREDAAEEILRVIQDKGYLFFEVFGVEDMRYGGDEIEKDTFLRKNGIIYHYFTVEEIEKLFSCSGYMDIEETRSKKVFRGKEYIRHTIQGVIGSI
ncbi:Methyltransferase type 11 [Methanosalsum zhilinae DSM 4017]|uniref:Methyltransferase type 11 n=1 Tax=Methanosalsum zhilinae (strain DSM 4017 / NBRC 107636 / OCM 62 / WeN5) TaxID=679901 RepID=F7XME5_METZD|nr:class I SAM-dependent methyltransferase [Methanosalsum zhilinae]AEH61737.1 Methyltransferase type 11 [Methanosalsum zhilinae DSM 4017]